MRNGIILYFWRESIIDKIMIWLIISLLFLLWLLGIILKVIMGGLVHLVLIVAVILLVINLLKTMPALGLADFRQLL